MSDDTGTAQGLDDIDDEADDGGDESGGSDGAVDPAGTAFGVGLAALLVSILSLTGTNLALQTIGLAGGVGGWYSAAVGALPVLGGVAGIALGAWTLRGRGTRVGHSFAVAAVAVGVYAVLVGGLSWYGQHHVESSLTDQGCVSSGLADDSGSC